MGNSGRPASAPSAFSSVGVWKRTVTVSTGDGSGSRSATLAAPRRLPNRLRGAFQIELFGALQFGAPAARAEALFRQAAERRAEVDQRRLVQIEDVRIQEEAVAGRNRQAIQVRHAQHERARPVGQAARGGAQRGSRFEQARVDAGRHGIAQHSAERAAHHVGALAEWEVNLIQGAEMKTESVELERGHDLDGCCDVLLLYNGKAFDSCFPLRTKFERGLRESIRTPFFRFSGRNRRVRCKIRNSKE